MRTDKDNLQQTAKRQYKARKFSEAIKTYTLAIASDPDNPELYAGRGVIYFLLDKSEEALADYANAIDLGTRELHVYWNCADLRRDLGDNEGALFYYSEAVRIDPSNALTFQLRGHFYRKTGRVVEAIKDYYRVITLDPKAQITFVWGYGEDRCITDFDALLQVYPNMFELYFLRATARGSKGNTSGAIADLEEAIKLNPDSTILKEYLNKFKLSKSNISVNSEDGTGVTTNSGTSAKEGSVLLTSLEDTPQLNSGYTKPPEQLSPRNDNATQNPINIDKSFPVRIQTLIYKTLDTIRRHPTHQFLPSIRREFYASIAPEDNAFAWRVRGWLAILSAQRVLPIFQEVFPEESLPADSIGLAEALLKRFVEQEAARGKISEADAIADSLWGYPDEEVPANAMLAGWAANSAALAASGFDALSRLRNYIFNATPGAKSQTVITDLDILGQGDTASHAAMAASSDEVGHCDPEKLLVFWEWWLTEALSTAWKFALGSPE